jgi:hypothetical protein
LPTFRRRAESRGFCPAEPRVIAVKAAGRPQSPFVGDRGAKDSCARGEVPCTLLRAHMSAGAGARPRAGAAGNSGPASFARSAGHVLDGEQPTQTIRFNIHTSMSTELSSGRLLYNSRYECGRSGRRDRREGMGSADFRLLDFRLRSVGVGRQDFTLLTLASFPGKTVVHGGVPPS